MKLQRKNLHSNYNTRKVPSSFSNNTALKIKPMASLRLLMAPRMIIVGKPEHTQNISDKVKKLGYKTTEVKYIKDLKRAVNETTAGIIFRLPMARGKALSLKKNLDKDSKFKFIPFYAIVPEKTTNHKERELYKCGFRVIFEWPREKTNFTKTMSNLFQQGVHKVKSTDVDKSLRLAVENRIKTILNPELGHLETDVNGTVLEVKGRVKTEGIKNHIMDELKNIPGVSLLNTESLEVAYA